MSKKTEPKTLVVNLFAGPGAGKSTLAAGLFAQLKLAGVSAELVTEYAKEKTRRQETTTLFHQPYVTVKQWFRQCAADGQVQVIVTDSPILLGLIYRGRGCTPSFDRYVLELFHEFWNYNVFVVRDPKDAYSGDGRNQTPDEAKLKDRQLRHLLEEYGVRHRILQARGEETIAALTGQVLAELGMVS
jgi:predicted ATPase